MKHVSQGISCFCYESGTGTLAQRCLVDCVACCRFSRLDLGFGIRNAVNTLGPYVPGIRVVLVHQQIRFYPCVCVEHSRMPHHSFYCRVSRGHSPTHSEHGGNDDPDISSSERYDQAGQENCGRSGMGLWRLVQQSTLLPFLVGGFFTKPEYPAKEGTIVIQGMLPQRPILILEPLRLATEIMIPMRLLSSEIACVWVLPSRFQKDPRGSGHAGNNSSLIRASMRALGSTGIKSSGLWECLYR